MADTDVTVRDLIVDALIELGVVGVADANNVDPEILNLALRRLLAMYGAFQAMRLLLFSVSRTTYALTPNLQVHTIGPSGCTITAPRPMWIARAGIVPVGDTIDLKLHQATRQEWFDEPLKTLTDSYPQRVFYDPLATELTGSLTFWPIQTTACTLTLATPVPLVVPSGDISTILNTVLTFAPGYQEAWLYNLAKRLARPFRKKVSPDLYQDAKESLSLVARLNDAAPAPARSDPALLGMGGGGYDIRSNESR